MLKPSFSSQTITTLGYGRVAPVGIQASTIAAIESMLGLLAFALATGLLYGRFSESQGKHTIQPTRRCRAVSRDKWFYVQADKPQAQSTNRSGSNPDTFHAKNKFRDKRVFYAGP
ncbi:MAG: two pore domain potassium channel family protein [Saprospiraceae bacterium]|nr:two pore domain potassium channel family protein [Saprospiraceae bacterium]